jgi:hypothetical protein
MRRGVLRGSERRGPAGSGLGRLPRDLRGPGFFPWRVRPASIRASPGIVAASAHRPAAHLLEPTSVTSTGRDVPPSPRHPCGRGLLDREARAVLPGPGTGGHDPGRAGRVWRPPPLRRRRGDRHPGTPTRPSLGDHREGCRPRRAAFDQIADLDGSTDSVANYPDRGRYRPLDGFRQTLPRPLIRPRTAPLWAGAFAGATPEAATSRR